MNWKSQYEVAAAQYLKLRQSGAFRLEEEIFKTKNTQKAAKKAAIFIVDTIVEKNGFIAFDKKATAEERTRHFAENPQDGIDEQLEQFFEIIRDCHMAYEIACEISDEILIRSAAAFSERIRI